MKLKKRKIKYSAIFFICWFALLVILVDGFLKFQTLVDYFGSYALINTKKYATQDRRLSHLTKQVGSERCRHFSRPLPLLAAGAANFFPVRCQQQRWLLFPDEQALRP